MGTFIPYINPIRLRLRGSEVNYQNRFPKFDIMTQRTNYQRGVIAQKYSYPDYLFGGIITFQFFTSTPLSILDATLYLPNGTTTPMTITDITPSGWTSESIYVASKSVNNTGIHRAVIRTGMTEWYDSDEFNAIDLVNSEKNIVVFTYSDSENRLEYGGGYYDGDGGSWSPTAYFTGIIKKIPASREETVFVDEPGNPITLQVTASKSVKIILTDIHEQYIDVIEEIIKVDTLYINKKLMTITDFSYEEKDINSDIGDITMTATYTDNTGYMDF